MPQSQPQFAISSTPPPSPQTPPPLSIEQELPPSSPSPQPPQPQFLIFWEPPPSLLFQQLSQPESETVSLPTLSKSSQTQVGLPELPSSQPLASPPSSPQFRPGSTAASLLPLLLPSQPQSPPPTLLSSKLLPCGPPPLGFPAQLSTVWAQLCEPTILPWDLSPTIVSFQPPSG